MTKSQITADKAKQFVSKLFRNIAKHIFRRSDGSNNSVRANKLHIRFDKNTVTRNTNPRSNKLHLRVERSLTFFRGNNDSTIGISLFLGVNQCGVNENMNSGNSFHGCRDKRKTRCSASYLVRDVIKITARYREHGNQEGRVEEHELTMHNQ